MATLNHYRNIGLYYVNSYSSYIGRNYSYATVMDDYGNLVQPNMDGGFTFTLIEMAEFTYGDKV